MPLPIHYAPEVTFALAHKHPVLALESTLIAHGMPYPQNLETAQRLEAQARDMDVVPATVAILNGQWHIGLTPEQLEFLATAPNVHKASRRDLPLYLAQGANAATTVATTMIAAQLAGIRVFATGGIGGVHRGAAQTFDISADLQELAHTSVAVVSAGAKSILDLRLTLEYLETMGVPVICYGTDEFPAFYTRQSGIPAPHRLDEVATIAQSLHLKWSLGLRGGALIANPVPEAHSMPPQEIEAAIEAALQAADQQGIHGKALTPFLLGEISRLTQGHSLFSNIQLVLNNLRLGAELATELAKLG